MPVHRSHFGSGALRQAVRGTKQDPRQRQHSAQQMQAVRSGKDVEKAAARIRREKQARGSELLPRDDLTREKEHAKNRGDAPPVAKALLVVRFEKFARVREREAAGDQHRGVKPQDSRNCERVPAAIRNILTHDVGADERHEEHQDTAEADGHSRDVSPLRNGAAAARSVTARATRTVIRAAGRRAATPAVWRSNFYLDVVCDDAWHLNSGVDYSFSRATSCGVKFCGTKSSFTPGTLKSYGPR